MTVTAIRRLVSSAGVFALLAVFLAGTGCSLKQADESVTGKSAAFRTVDGQSISQDGSEEYSPFVVQKSDGYLIAVFGSDRSCGGCTTGKHHIFVTTSATPYGNNGVLPFFNIPQALTVASAEQYWDSSVSFAVVKSGNGARIYLNNTSGNIVYADYDPSVSTTNVTGLVDITNSTWKTHTVVGAAADGVKIFTRSGTGQIYFFDPSGSDTTLTPLSSSQGSGSVVHISPMHVPRPDAFMTIQGNQVVSSSFLQMGGPVTGLNIALQNSRISVRNISVLYSQNRPGEMVFISGIQEGSSKQDMFMIEGAPPSLLWDQTFPKPGEMPGGIPGGGGGGNYMTFQQANFVLGVPNFTTQGTFDIVDMEENMGTIYLSQATAPGTLHVYPMLPNANNQAAAFTATGYTGGIAIDNGKMIRTKKNTPVEDIAFFAMPVGPGPFGTPDYSFGTTGTTAGQTEFGNANEWIAARAGRLLFPDRASNRVIVWNAVPTSGAQNPNFVLGQANFASTAATTTQTGLSNPGKPWTNGMKLVVPDAGNNRVLIWNNFPNANAAAADIVLGQANFTGATVNAGGVSASSLSGPIAVASDGNKLAVLDAGNNRILIWNSFPTSNNQPANIVLGQNDFTHVTANDDNQDNTNDNAGAPVSPRVFKTPKIMLMMPNALLLSDFGHGRVLVFMAQP